MDSQHHLPSQEGPASPPLYAEAEENQTPPPILSTFYRGTIDSTLSSYLTMW